MKLKKIVLSMLGASAMMIAGQASAVSVALELALLVDVSGSVDSSEFTLQQNGYKNAFLDPTLQANIASLTGGIAVTYIQWSGANQQAVKVGWTHISNAAEAITFANLVGGATRSFTGMTAPGSALNFATPLFSGNDFEGARQVIDVSGDGSQNDGATTSTARDSALAAGIDAINGLAILGSENGLENWYNNNIKGGTNGFVIAAAGFDDFDRAVKLKIGREVNDVPEPTSLALVGLALAGAGMVRRRTAKKS